MKVALITGGSAGIGKAIAARLAQENYQLILAARDQTQLTQTAQTLETDHAVQVLPIQTDVRDPEQVQKLVKSAIAQFGQLNILINNAGIYSTGPAEEFTLEDWHKVIDTNLWGYIHTIHAILPYFLTQKSGTIINICSIAGKLPMAYHTPYTTSKFAIAGLSQSLSAELAPKGIQVSAIYPNIIQTNFPERAVIQGKDPQDRNARQKLLDTTLTVPLIEKPEDVANAVWQALEKNESEHIVGTAKLINGMHSILPSLTEWAIRTVFKNKA